MIRRASERKTGKEVAIKTVSRDQIDKAGIRREIIVLQRLNSDRLVKILKSYHTGKVQNWKHPSKIGHTILRGSRKTEHLYLSQKQSSRSLLYQNGLLVGHSSRN